MKLFLMVFLVVLSACKDTQADSDVGLYDPVAPEGSSFVRFVNLEAEAMTPKIGRKKYDVLNNMQVSPYYVVPKGESKIDVGNQSLEHNFLAGQFYTATSRVNIIQDQTNTNRSKATIAFYNLSNDNDITLKARNGTVDVLKNVESGSMQARDMNAVKIDLSLHDCDQQLITLDEEVLERGNHYSVIYYGQMVKLITATTNTRK